MDDSESERDMGSNLRRGVASGSGNRNQYSRRLERMPDRYESEHYTRLPSSRGAIRLLNLHASSPDNPDIEGELINYDAYDPNSPPVPSYEALSWNWGPEDFSEYISIRKGRKIYAKMIKPTLFKALKVLRHHQHDRYLWIDLICINQDFLTEKNHQVELMSEIYGRANRVCIWLGDSTRKSRIALRFIHDQVLQLQDFDDLCNDQENSPKWLALLDLMQRAWFSRRWVVQEIALARKAVLYCGLDNITWNKFAVAVELFVEVETATHRLSEVMKKDPNFFHVPGWFEYVSALGASLLVDATGRLFRDDKGQELSTTRKRRRRLRYVEPDHLSDSEAASDTERDERAGEESTQRSASTKSVIVKPFARGQPLLGLEYLVTSLSIFESTVPHDTIYALLAIAKDTTPVAAHDPANEQRAQQLLEVFTQRKSYNVDYNADYVDVCKDFIQFCISRSIQSDPTRALDVLCRPWAMDDKTLRSRRQANISRLTEEVARQKQRDDAERRRRQKIGVDLAGIENGLNPKHVQDCKAEIERLRATEPLPSWVPQLSGATYNMYAHPGVDGIKMGRMNADVLVGLPSLNQRNYMAAESKKVDMDALRFVKRAAEPVTPQSDIRLWDPHYSMYVSGFQLDVIKKVEQHSQNGAIPREWAELVGWNDPSVEPCPDKFWRTLVADRGRDGRNPPVYYARACRECFEKGGLRGGAVDTSGLINNERNSIVAQFCRRVQAVIWNRALAETEGGTLALVGPDVRVGDKVCILYGCSVPVILRQAEGKKTPAVLERELDLEIQNVKDQLKSFIRTNRERKRKLRERKKAAKKTFAEWERSKKAEWLKDHAWRTQWQQQWQHELTAGVQVERRSKRGRHVIVKAIRQPPGARLTNGTTPARVGGQHGSSQDDDADLSSEDDEGEVDLRGYSSFASYSRYTKNFEMVESSGRRMQKVLQSYKPGWMAIQQTPQNKLWNGCRDYVKRALIHIELRKSQEFNAWKREKGRAAKERLHEWERLRDEHEKAEKAAAAQAKAQDTSIRLELSDRRNRTVIEVASLPPVTNAVQKLPAKPEPWGPGVIDWRKFDLRLKYFRRWRTNLRRQKLQRQKSFWQAEHRERRASQQKIRLSLADPNRTARRASLSAVAGSKQVWPAGSALGLESIKWPIEVRDQELLNALEKKKNVSLTRSSTFGASLSPDARSRYTGRFEPRMTHEEWRKAVRKSLQKKRGEDAKHYFQFMGECYIHKMMDGEAMAFQNGANHGGKVIKSRVFELR